MSKTIKHIKIKGMHCVGCEGKITESLKKIDGVEKVRVSYDKGTAKVLYDPEKVDLEDLFVAVEENGYNCCELNRDKTEKEKTNWPRVLGIAFGIIGILFIAYFAFGLVEGAGMPQISSGMGYGLLFLVGLLTGFHCVAMCGGFVITYTAKDKASGRKPHWSHVLYGFGKVLSYTLIGALFGLLGSIIAFTPTIRGVAGILAGIFLIIFGINMLDIFPFLRKFRIRMPGFMNKFISSKSQKYSSPFIIGLLNGLMIACGPLQAMYIMAAGTGSMIEGAKLLFIFGLGTLPVMLGFGYLASIISSKAVNNILKISGIIVIVLGLIMVNRGLALSGSGYDANSIVAKITQGNNAYSGNNANTNVPGGNTAATEGNAQTIRMSVDGSGYAPNSFVLKKGVPVKWIITVTELTGCNQELLAPKYNIDIHLKQGEQTVEFTPTETGVVSFTCGMGMLQGNFVVKDDLSDPTPVNAVTGNAAAPKAGSTCGMNGGKGCGCGMMR